MGIEMIIGLATALLAVIAGAFGIGHARGTSKAEVTKEASDVQQTVSHMPDDDVDRELREHFTRPGSR